MITICRASHAAHAILFLHHIPAMWLPYIWPCIRCTRVVPLYGTLTAYNGRHFSGTFIIWTLTACASLAISWSVRVAWRIGWWRVSLSQVKCTTVHITDLQQVKQRFQGNSLQSCGEFLIIVEIQDTLKYWQACTLKRTTKMVIKR